MNERDFFQAQLLHYKTSSLWAFAVLLVMLALNLAVFGAMEKFRWIMIMALIGGVAGLVFFYVHLRFKCRKIYRQQKSLQATYQVSWDDENIYSKSEFGEVQLPWNTFIKYKQNDQLVLLYQSDLLFNIFPKGAFSEEELGDFTRHLEKISS